MLRDTTKRHARAPTIRDVAEQAGVSVATVSRVMNRSGVVSEARREAVERAMKATGFRPNSIGRMLKTQRSRTIGVLVPSLKNPIFADAVHGIQTASAEGLYNVLLMSTDYDPTREAQAVETLLANRVEGVVLTVADESRSPALDMLRRAHTPFVLLFNPALRADCSTVTVDNAAAAKAIVGGLIDRGHRRIGIIVGRLAASDRSELRRRGYGAALAQAGLAPGPALEVDFDADDLTAACREIVAHRPCVTALFCSTDLLAIRAMRALSTLGIAVPGQIAVAGFDGIAAGEWITPSLATVVQPAEDMGGRAARHLLDRVTGVSPPCHLVLEHRIRPGDSWGAAPVPSGASDHRISATADEKPGPGRT